MFKLSTKGRYGTRLMVDIARHCSCGPVRLSEIAKRQEISVKYLEHLIAPLKKAKLVAASRGARGGYLLARPASKITLKDIISAVEGDLCVVKCAVKPSVCRRSSKCPTRGVWSQLAGKISETLDSITLQKIAEQGYPKKKQEAEICYAI